MNAYCPECETELDQATGICPACRWDPMVAHVAAVAQDNEPGLSLTERYRGTRFNVMNEQVTMQEQAGFSKGRAVVIVGLVAGVILYGGVISAMGLF